MSELSTTDDLRKAQAELDARFPQYVKVAPDVERGRRRGFLWGVLDTIRVWTCRTTHRLNSGMYLTTRSRCLSTWKRKRPVRQQISGATQWSTSSGLEAVETALGQCLLCS